LGSNKSITQLSKFLSYILRHNPDAIGLELDPHGWAHIEALIEKAKLEGKPLSRKKLQEIIDSSSKNRFTISDDGEYIRAGYGHSIDINLALSPQNPPKTLYHGTARKNVESIMKEGLHPGSRNYVHLSSDKDDAVSVGQRHGMPIVLSVQAQSMQDAGYRFYRSESEEGIWMVKEVPSEFISE
jgi:putative RNA 2'-phosphotransferase